MLTIAAFGIPLFFSGKNTTPPVKPSPEIIPPTDIQSGTTSLPTKIQTHPNDPLAANLTFTGAGEVTVLLPASLYHEGWKKFAQELLFQHNILVRYKTVATLHDYKQLLLSGGLNAYQIDIALIPLDWLSGMDTRMIDFKESLIPYFHPLFSSLLTSQVISFVPYALDPLLTFTVADTPLTSSSTPQLLSYILMWNKKRPKGFPLVRGIQDADLTLLAQ